MAENRDPGRSLRLNVRVSHAVPKPAKAISHRAPPKSHAAPKRPGKRKKRKSFKRKLWSEMLDVLEDIFD